MQLCICRLFKVFMTIIFKITKKIMMVDFDRIKFLFLYNYLIVEKIEIPTLQTTNFKCNSLPEIGSINVKIGALLLVEFWSTNKRKKTK